MVESDTKKSDETRVRAETVFTAVFGLGTVGVALGQETLTVWSNQFASFIHQYNIFNGLSGDEIKQSINVIVVSFFIIGSISKRMQLSREQLDRFLRDL